MDHPEWLSVGSDAILLYPGYFHQKATIITVSRHTSTQVIAGPANSKFRRNSSGGYHELGDPSRRLVSILDPEGLAGLRGMRIVELCADIEMLARRACMQASHPIQVRETVIRMVAKSARLNQLVMMEGTHGPPEILDLPPVSGD